MEKKDSAPTTTPQQALETISAAVQARGGIPNLAKAYVAAAGELDNVLKNAANPHFGSNYADLAQVLNTYKPVFHKYGLALFQAPGDIDGDKLSLNWILFHESGETINGRSQFPIGPKSTAQAAGSALTYARRYNASAIAGIAQVDDDGNPSADEKPKKAKKDAGPGAEAHENDRAALLAEIEAMTTATAAAVKKKVAEMGDSKIADAFLARKKVLAAELEAAKGAN